MTNVHRLEHGLRRASGLGAKGSADDFRERLINLDGLFGAAAFGEH